MYTEVLKAVVLKLCFFYYLAPRKEEEYGEVWKEALRRSTANMRLLLHSAWNGYEI